MQVADVYRLKRPRLADLKFPVAFAVSIGCAEMLALEGIDYLTGGALGRAAELFSGELPGATLLTEILFAVALVPLLEELFFRGFFMSSMVDMGPGWAVMLPSLFFALAHEPFQWLTTFIGAVAFSVFVLETGSIAAGVAGHAATNLVGTLLPTIHEILPGTTGNFACLILRVAGVATGLLFIRQYKSLWLSFRQYWADFRREPGIVGGARYLLKRWPYWVLLVLLLAAICLYGVMIVRGGPIKVG